MKNIHYLIYMKWFEFLFNSKQVIQKLTFRRDFHPFQFWAMACFMILTLIMCSCFTYTLNSYLLGFLIYLCASYLLLNFFEVVDGKNKYSANFKTFFLIFLRIEDFKHLEEEWKTHQLKITQQYLVSQSNFKFKKTKENLQNRKVL